jgi:CheY-like chemotaxis protein
MKTVLIVDDEPVVRRVLTLALEQARYKVVSASNGEEALDLVRDSHPDVLITDIEMPRMSGEALCKKLNEEMPDRAFPIFVVTSVTAVEHREWSRDLPNVMFLEKPISARKLLARLRDYFSGTPAQEAC